MEAGGVRPLIAFLQDSNSRIQFFAAACTWVLAAYQDEFQEALFEAGAVPALLQLVTQGHEDIAWQAAGALRNIVLKNRESIPHPLSSRKETHVAISLPLERVHAAVANSNGLEHYCRALRMNSGLSERILGLVIQAFVILSSSGACPPQVGLH